MPTYEYECKTCSFSFETFQSMSEPPLKDCPKCGKEIRRLIFGGTGVIFKGSGFYVTDKSKAESKKKEPAESAGSCAGCPAKTEGVCPSAVASSAVGSAAESSAGSHTNKAAAKKSESKSA